MARPPKSFISDLPGDSVDDLDTTGLTGEQPPEQDLQSMMAELAELRAMQAATRKAGLLAKEAGDFDPSPREKIPAGTKTARRIRIVLEENSDISPTGLFIQINGRPYILQPAMEADVPPEVVNVLNDAVMSTPVVDPLTQRVTGFRSRLRFPYRVVDPNYVNPRAS